MRINGTPQVTEEVKTASRQALEQNRETINTKIMESVRRACETYSEEALVAGRLVQIASANFEIEVDGGKQHQLCMVFAQLAIELYRARGGKIPDNKGTDVYTAEHGIRHLQGKLDLVREIFSDGFFSEAMDALAESDKMKLLDRATAEIADKAYQKIQFDEQNMEIHALTMGLLFAELYKERTRADALAKALESKADSREDTDALAAYNLSRERGE